MIIRSEIDGRPCAVQFLTRDYQPTSEVEAEMVRVIFDDGETMLAYAGDKDANEVEVDDADDDRKLADEE
jgi:hypothetical protein